MVQRLIKAVVVALACAQAAWAVPVVTLTAPANNASYASPASITLSAQASDTGDSIAKVEFYVSSALIGAVTQTPYTVNWTNVASGSYIITAKATNSAGASAVSDPVTVNVTGAAAGGGQAAPVYYIQPDHLNTPRVITDSSNNVVWRWDNAEPFGNNVANENPSGLGTFTYNLRFPGQYFDRETNLHYNYFRDYDPSTGRYIESDPIGLGGGINTFAYAYNAPTMYTDPSGLFVDENGTYLAPAAVAATVAAPVAAVAGAAALAGAATYQACHPDDEDKCKKIIAEIYEVMNVVEGRLADLYVDSLNLYNLAYSSPSPSLPKGSGSYKGHVTQVTGWQRKLRDLVDRATKMGCKVPPYARELAYAPIPTRPALPVK